MKIFVFSIILCILTIPLITNALVSDNFPYGTTLNTDVWEFVDPVGDCSVSLIDGNAEISVPIGNHNLYTGSNNLAPRLLQAAFDENFSIEVKFESTPSTPNQYQMQGIIVQESFTKFIRFGTYSDGNSTELFCAFIDGNTPYGKLSASVTPIPHFLRVERSDVALFDWKYSYSDDGSTWTTAVEFDQPITVTEVGFYGGNADNDSSPAFIAKADYFWNLAQSFPVPGDLIITEIDTNLDRGAFVEIYNNTESTIDLSNYSLIHYNGSSPANLTAPLSGTLTAGSYYIIARDQTNFESTYGFSADQYESTMFLDGGNEWLGLNNGTRSVDDYFGADGATWSVDHVFERTGYPNNGTSMDDWTDIGDIPGSPNADNDNPLPVNLSAFYALYIGGTPIISWVTQSETDNIGWNVYRSYSQNFGQAQILNLNTIPGNGTTSQPSFYSFTDEYEVYEGFTYWYWLESISSDGETESFGPISLTIPSEGNGIPEIPMVTELHQNFPNPFNPNTLISFDIKENETGILSIYNIKGQLIVTDEFEEGRHYYAWDSRDHSSGVYLYKLQVGKYSKTMKMLLVK